VGRVPPGLPRTPQPYGLDGSQASRVPAPVAGFKESLRVRQEDQPPLAYDSYHSDINEKKMALFH
jgi:hypothetical protein